MILQINQWQYAVWNGIEWNYIMPIYTTDLATCDNKVCASNNEQSCQYCDNVQFIQADTDLRSW